MARRGPNGPKPHPQTLRLTQPNHRTLGQASSGRRQWHGRKYRNVFGWIDGRTDGWMEGYR